MAQRFYIIDGYNLLHAAGFARVRYGPGDLHRARVRLLGLLAEHLDDDSRGRMEIIFDAQDPPPDSPSQTQVHGMRVCYSVETGEADALIEARIRAHFAPSQLWVVSSDHRLIAAARRRRSHSLTSEAFLERLFGGRIARRSVDPSSEATDIRGISTADWLAFFGFDECTSIAVDVPEPDQSLPPLSISQDHPESARPGAARSKERSQEPSEDIAFWQRRIDEVFDEP